MDSLLSQIDSLGRFVTKNVEYTLRVLLMVYLSIRATVLDQAQGFRTIVGVRSITTIASECAATSRMFFEDSSVACADKTQTINKVPSRSFIGFSSYGASISETGSMAMSFP